MDYDNAFDMEFRAQPYDIWLVCLNCNWAMQVMHETAGLGDPARPSDFEFFYPQRMSLMVSHCLGLSCGVCFVIKPENIQSARAEWWVRLISHISAMPWMKSRVFVHTMSIFKFLPPCIFHVCGCWGKLCYLLQTRWFCAVHILMSQAKFLCCA